MKGPVGIEKIWYLLKNYPDMTYYMAYIYAGHMGKPLGPQNYLGKIDPSLSLSITMDNNISKWLK